MAAGSNHTEVIDTLTAAAAAILEKLIPVGSDIALLDYPDFTNVGDSLIWIGQMRYLRSRGLTPSYICSAKNYNAAALRGLITPNTVILLSGGGNFGTLYPNHQVLRECVLQDFPQTAIVQLPQSIHFDDATAIEQSRQAINAHQNFTLLARDQASLNFARNFYQCRTALCPDMAFFLGPLKAESSIYDVIGLVRADKESGGEIPESLVNMTDSHRISVTDWIKSTSRSEQRLTKLIKRLQTALTYIDPSNRILGRLWYRLANARLCRGIKLLSSGDLVVTDRLHGHILALLLGRRHIVLDNSNKKVSEFHRTWTSISTITELCDTPENLQKILLNALKLPRRMTAT